MDWVWLALAIAGVALVLIFAKVLPRYVRGIYLVTVVGMMLGVWKGAEPKVLSALFAGLTALVFSLMVSFAISRIKRRRSSR